MGKRRTVTDEEFQQALANKDNIRIIRTILNRYKNIIPKDELDNCGLDGLWRCLGYHVPGKGCKLTTYLWTFVYRECCRTLKKIYKQRSYNVINFSAIQTDGQFDTEDERQTKESKISYMRDCITCLPKSSQELIQEYYFDKQTMEEIGRKHGYSKEAARQKINRATDQLRKVCLAGV